MEYEVEKILKQEIRNEKTYYYLKWVGYNNRYNTWEPEENLNCDELLADFNKSRAVTVLGVGKKGGQVLYLMQFHDENEPILKYSAQASIWSKDLLKFLISQISFDGFDEEVAGASPNNVLSTEEVPAEEVPDIICKDIYIIQLFMHKNRLRSA
ncbi:histone-lysine N-methyltransferase SUV39H1-A-like [Contarinia nasturtii]|uniref:histone-lysine N-methyltransferase SUV39H1-A-like n=1 Tax=Contarinia nasturtii TaxID=265458 RepID=UPI0012D45C9C|nr:histone-lysine N-methyltransferase SUV39H1-A-like [Contarinia nasturtii]